MFKPVLAVVFGLVCVPVGAVDSGGPGAQDVRLGVDAERGSKSRWYNRPGGADALGEPFAQVPATHSAYGWRYPFAFPLETSQTRRRKVLETLDDSGIRR
jgi:hypothetical protein